MHVNRDASDPIRQDVVEQDLQVRSLLEAVYERYGLDFRNYAGASIKRRIEKAMRAEQLASISQLQSRLLSDQDCVERFLTDLTVHVTSMFRDPGFYRALREHVIPAIRSRGFLRIWHAGCSTGEEVFSLAILLREEGISQECRIYATDVNSDVVARAKQGVFPLRALREYSTNYIAAGGTQPFSTYYTACYGHVVFHRTLVTNIVFSQHNLVSDGPFNQFDLILCRNVMIYFSQSLIDQVHQLLYDSLLPGGFLCLGSSETIQFTRHALGYQPFHAEHRIYQKQS